MSTLNFDEFAPSTMQDWQRLVAKELGEKSMESLNWTMDEGVVAESYVLASDESFAMELPAQWEMVQRISANNAKQWNTRALESLMGGANALVMSTAPTEESEFHAMLDGVLLQYISLHIEQSHDWKSTSEHILQWCEKHQLNSKELRGAFAANSNTFSDDDFKWWVTFVKNNFILFRGLAIDVRHMHDSGGSAMQEIAYALTEGHAVLARCLDARLSIDEASALIQFNFSTGSSYFTEIAKYRAFRWAWKSIIEQYQPQYACSVHTHIQASTSRYTQTAKDAHNNLLRATTQAMSAIVGGVNGLLVESYNSWSSNDDDAALRWSRNIQQLLTEESYFEQYRAAANGAHYVESLTGKMVHATWSLFQHWDAVYATKGAGAFREVWQSAAEDHRQRMLAELNDGKRIVVGVNKYVNKADTSVVDSHAKTLTASLENS
jgi:methylmalonyl-CoA mutase